VTRARGGALLLLLAVAWVLPPRWAHGQEPGGRAAVVVRVRAVSFEELLAIPEVAALARAGGAGLLANPEDVATVVGGPGERERTLTVDPGRAGGLDAAGALVRRAVSEAPPGQLLVIVLGEGSSAEMRALKDELVGIAIAVGTPAELFPDGGRAGSLTSDSTRREGVVTGGDVRATLDAFLGGAALFAGEPAPGSPIETIAGPPPFELHARYLAQRRMSVPVGSAAALYVTGAGLLAVGCLAFGAPERPRRLAGWAALAVPALASGLLAAGHLPELTYATVVPFVAIVTVFGTMAFSPLARRSVVQVPAGIGVAVLAFFAVEAALGWSAALTPFLGGSHLDGARFFGLPNAFVGLLIGAGLYVAHALPTSRGVALLALVGLGAGLPLLGSNLGGGVSLFAAAGLWLAVREGDRLGPWGRVGAFLGAALLGSAVLLLAHALSPVPTHVTRFGEAGGLAGVWDAYADRLRIGFELVARNPAALIPVVGLPIVLGLILRPPDAIRASFERWPAWRDAMLVTALAGIVAYLANDSGPAAAGLAFGLGLGGILGVSLLSAPGNMEGS